MMHDTTLQAIDEVEAEMRIRNLIFWYVNCKGKFDKEKTA